MSRLILLAVLAAAVVLVGCSGEEEQTAPAYTETETDEYMNNIYAEARQEWQPLAEAGDASSQRQLGVMYYLGQGVERDYDQAYEWFSKAAEQGESIAQLFLGVMFSEGHGVEEDLAKAQMWLSLSAAQDNPGAIARLEELAPRLTPDQVAEARRLVEEWRSAHP